MMSELEDNYPCVGVCMVDADGYCLGCGRPPLPAPIPKDETTRQAEADEAERLSGSPSSEASGNLRKSG